MSGGWDEQFFMYYEDVDFCYRIKKAGWRIVFYPEAVIKHLGGRSSSQVPLKRVMALTSLVAYFRKHHQAKFALTHFLIAFKVGVILRHFSHLLSGILASVVALAVGDHERKKTALDKIKLNGLLIRKYTWRIMMM